MGNSRLAVCVIIYGGGLKRRVEAVGWNGGLERWVAAVGYDVLTHRSNPPQFPTALTDRSSPPQSAVQRSETCRSAAGSNEMNSFLR